MLYFALLFLGVLSERKITQERIDALRQEALAKSSNGHLKGSNKPNFVLFYPDDFGYNDVSYHSLYLSEDYYDGSMKSPYETVNMDTLATNGAMFTAFYTGPVCTPARCALMSGRHIMRTGCHGDVGNNNNWGLNLNEILIPEVLMSRGYYSVLYGKWHLGHYSWEHMPTMRGFSEFKGFLGGAVGKYTHSDNNVLDWWNGLDVYTDDYGDWATYILEDNFQDLVDRKVSGEISDPFFAYLSLTLPHGPYQAPDDVQENFEDEWGSGSDETLWLSEVKMFDDLVGNVFDILDDAGLLQDTYIMMAGDHGAPDNEPGNLEYSRDYPWNGGKGNIYEGGTRTPFFIYNPNMGSHVISDLVSVTDIMPTITDLAGVQTCNTPSNLDGQSLVDLWESGSSWSDRVLLVEANVGNCNRRRAALESGTDQEWLEKNDGPAAAIRYGDYKLMGCATSDGSFSGDVYFYDLSDGGEDENLYGNLDSDQSDAYDIMESALLQYATEAYPQYPDWNDGVYCPDNCDNDCGNPEVNGFAALVPWSVCDTTYQVSNDYEDYAYVCQPMCIGGEGEGNMVTDPISSNRAAGTNGDCSGFSPTREPTSGSDSGGGGGGDDDDGGSGGGGGGGGGGGSERNGPPDGYYTGNARTEYTIGFVLLAGAFGLLLSYKMYDSYDENKRRKALAKQDAMANTGAFGSHVDMTPYTGSQEAAAKAGGAGAAAASKPTNQPSNGGMDRNPRNQPDRDRSPKKKKRKRRRDREGLLANDPSGKYGATGPPSNQPPVAFSNTGALFASNQVVYPQDQVEQVVKAKHAAERAKRKRRKKRRRGKHPKLGISSNDGVAVGRTEEAAVLTPPLEEPYDGGSFVPPAHVDGYSRFEPQQRHNRLASRFGSYASTSTAVSSTDMNLIITTANYDHEGQYSQYGQYSQKLSDDNTNTGNPNETRDDK